MPLEPRLAELIGALTVATDLGAGVPAESALRTALLAAEIARAAGLEAADISAAYWAGLLRYLGCSGFAHETAPFGNGNDQAVLATFEAADPARVAEIIGLAVKQLGRGGGAVARATAVARFLAAPDMPRQLADAHCAQAVTLARRLGVGEACLTALAQIYERWDGRGQPNRHKGEQTTLPARVLHLANALEIHLRLGGRAGALAMAAERRGSHFDPDLVDAVLAQGAQVLAAAEAPTVWDAFLAAEPMPHAGLPDGGLPTLALAFARYVDLKSPYTLGHSVGVGALCRRAATTARFGAADVEALELAGLLHDLGSVAVPNGIWDKAAAWSAAERERAMQHSQQTERILRTFGPWRGIADLAAGHHERLDGSGYHRRLPAAGLSPSMRLLAAVDVFQALTEVRCHRPAATPEAAADTLRGEAQAGRLDNEAVEWVLITLGQATLPQGIVSDTQTKLTGRECEVLRLLARGLSNKQMARALFISPVTVKNHVAHIYEKTGVASRAAAALFAVDNALV